MTSDTVHLITVPRQPFSGWFVSVKAFWRAGLSDVVFIFSKGKLLLVSYWGDIQIPYEGSFQGTDWECNEPDASGAPAFNPLFVPFTQAAKAAVCRTQTRSSWRGASIWDSRTVTTATV